MSEFPGKSSQPAYLNANAEQLLPNPSEKMASNPLSNRERLTVNPQNLRFTQSTINSSFTDTSLPKVEEAISLIKKGKLDPDVFGELSVHIDKYDMGMWCEDNRRLYVFRKAGVSSVPVKIIGSASKSRMYNEEDKKKLKDPAFLPRIRGQTSGFQIPSQPNCGASVVEEEQQGSSLLGFVGAVSAVAAAGYWGWKYLNAHQDSEAAHGDDDDGKNKNMKE